MSSVSDTCGRQFSTLFNMRRHHRNIHKQDLYTKHAPLASGLATLQHPFTCIVAGCTQSGKTVWVKTLLENAQETIIPPERTIWCYGQMATHVCRDDRHFTGY